MLAGLRKFEVQARYAAILAVLSLLPCLGAIALAYRNFDWLLGRIKYGGGGRFVMGFAGCVLLSLAPGALALVLGLNSAGQKRNERSSQSWIGFFIGGAVVTVNVILLIAFFMLRLKV